VGLKRLLSSSIDEEYKKEFTDEITILNINRGKLSSNIIILIELILLTIDLIVSQWSIDTEFAFGYYGKMYLLMIIAMLVYGMAFIRMESLYNKKRINAKTIEMVMTSYITFLMVWGAVISFFDQQLYGNVVVFMVNIITCSLIFYLKDKLLLIAQLISLMLFMVGLPYFQASKYILIGHYVNVSIFVILSWGISRILYSNYIENFYSRWEIKKRLN